MDMIRNTSSEEEGTSSRASPSTTYRPNSSISTVTGRNVRGQDPQTVPKGSTSKVIQANKQKAPETQASSNPKRQSKMHLRPRLFPTTAVDCPASPNVTLIRSTIREVGGTSSRAGPSTTFAQPNSSMSAVTGSSTSTRSYTYTVLTQLKVTPKVNIFGVVKFFKPPYKTNGPDHCMMVNLVDPSLDENHPGFRCLLFQEEISALPAIHSIGDIVRFHRLKVTEFNGNIQGQKGDGFQCLVFDGGPSEGLEPRATSSNFTLTDNDTQRVKELRLWSTQCTQLTLDNPCRTLERCHSAQYFDLTCQVISVAVLPVEECVVVKVWDGTKIRGGTHSKDICTGTVVNKEQSLVDKAEGLGVDVSLCGNHMQSGKLLKPGQFIKICNLHAVNWREPGQEDTGKIELILQTGTSYGRGIIFLRPDIDKLKNMIQRMDEVAEKASTCTGTSGTRSMGTPERQARTGTPNMCMHRSASVINFPFQQKMTCLQDVINSESPNKFHIRAKVADYSPNDTEEFVHLKCSVCKLRCEVPSTTNTKPTHSRPASQERNARDQRQKTCLQENDQLMSSRGSRRVQTRSAARRSERVMNEESRVGAVTDSRQLEETGDSSSAESSPRRSVNPTGRLLKARKRPASENEHTARSTQTKNLAGTSTSTKESEKRVYLTTSHLVTFIAEMSSSSEDEKEAEESKRRKKTRVENDKVTLPQALLQNHPGITSSSHTDLPTRLDKDLRNQAPENQMRYVCPQCIPTDVDNPEAAVPGDAKFMNYRYRMELILNDGTGSIKVIVDGKHGETFFQGVPVANLYTSPETKILLEEKMAKLCPFPIGQDSDSPDEDANMAIGDYLTHPWLECSIISYAVNVGSKEVVKYNLIDTSLALDVE